PAGTKGHALGVSESLVRAECEDAVSLQRAAEGAAELIPCELGLGRREIVLLVELVGPEELGRRSRELIRPRFGDNRDDRVSLAVLGGERIAKQRHFLNGIDRR